MSVLGTISIGSTGLRVAAEAISVVGHNTTNANTEGYSRQRLSTSARDPITQGGLWVGQGVGADRLMRITDYFLDERSTSARGSAAEAESTYQAYQLVEASLTGDDTPADVLAAFFDALGEMADDPGNEGYRTTALSSAEELTARVRTLSGDMTIAQAGMTDSSEAVIATVNDSLARIAFLNGKIASGGGGDLMDERDRLIGELADTVGATVDYTNEGQATVFIGSHAAVMGDTARELTLEADEEGRPLLRLSVDKAAVTVTDGIGGKIGGYIAAWDLAAEVRGQLDTFVTTFAEAFNAQHMAGYDQDGNPGAEFFTFDPENPSGTFELAPDLAARQIAVAADPSAYAGDRGNVDALIGLQESLDLEGRRPQDYLSALSAYVGTAVAAAEEDYELEGAAYADLQQFKASVSAVDLDEEAADLIAWQTAYEAAARLISATDGLIGDLMEMVR